MVEFYEYTVELEVLPEKIDEARRLVNDSKLPFKLDENDKVQMEIYAGAGSEYIFYENCLMMKDYVRGKIKLHLEFTGALPPLVPFVEAEILIDFPGDGTAHLKEMFSTFPNEKLSDNVYHDEILTEKAIKDMQELKRLEGEAREKSFQRWLEKEKDLAPKRAAKEKKYSAKLAEVHNEILDEVEKEIEEEDRRSQ